MNHKEITYKNTTKKQWSEIAFDLAMRLSEDNEAKALKLLEREKELLTTYEGERE